MPPTVADKLEIADLMTGWIYRDRADWARLESLFHDDGTIEVTWFEGAFADFVTASKQMGASNLKTKHFVASPVIEFYGDKAVAETNAIIICDNEAAGLGCSAHSRFFDLLERRNGKWKILKRRCIYDMGTLSSTPGTEQIDPAMFKRFPHEYAALAYVLEVSGFPVKRLFPTRNSKEELAIRAASQRWLLGQ